jgi:hypothetical protein
MLTLRSVTIAIRRVATLCVVAILAAVPTPASDLRLAEGVEKANARAILLSVGPVGWQPGCPVRVSQTMSSSQRILEYVSVINRARVDVVSITLAIVATDATGRTRRCLDVYATHELDLRVPARGFAIVSDRFGTTQEAGARALRESVGHLRLEVGILRAQLADGTVFEADFDPTEGLLTALPTDDAFALQRDLAPALDSALAEFVASRESTSRVNKQATDPVSIADPKWTCVLAESNVGTKCKYQYVNGQRNCIEEACGKFGCSNTYCVQAIILD